MNTIISQIVGMHFRPPAKWVLARLPAGSGLLLRPEPDNPYDSKAVQVILPEPGKAVPQSQIDGLAAEIEGCGTDIYDLCQMTELHLGYLPDSDGKICQASDQPGNREVAEAIADRWNGVEAKLGFTVEGKPAVIVQVL